MPVVTGFYLKIVEAMFKSKLNFLLLIFISVITTQCKKKAFDEYYAPPASLAPPIYKQLEARGKFTTLLSLIDKAGYKHTLGAAGYWTFFAPTDSAFTNDAEFAAYLQSRGFANVAAVDSATAQSIVQFLLVFNGFEKDRLDDYQSNLGWVPDIAFKRRTAYYTGFYNDTSYNGQAYKAVASNRNNTGAVNSYYNTADNNNKHIPIFTNNFLTGKGLTASDYTYFYPGSTYTGFNVGKASVTEQDIAAENGVIHIINKVVTPLMSLDQYLRTKPEYSLFRSLYERFMVLFLQNADATRRYQVLTGKSDNVYVKAYSNLLAFSMNSENYFKLQDNDAQRDGWTLFVPKNDSLQRYINRVLLESYPSVEFLPLSVIADLLNAHMWQSTVWPSKFSSSYNFLGEPAKMNATTNIIDKKVLSNGMLYGTDKVNEPNVFATIYGRSYLNPNYSLMTRLLDFELKSVITNPSGKFAMLMISDAVFLAKGYRYDIPNNQWIYVNPVGGATSINDSNRLNLLRMINTCVFETPNDELAQLGQTGFSGIAATFGGECVIYNGNQLSTAGSLDRGLPIRIDSTNTSSNGRVYYINELPYFTYTPIATHLRILGTPTTSEYNLFWNYMRFSTAYDSVNVAINGTSGGAFYTIFVPNNTQMRAAITAGLLPGTAAVPNFKPTLTADKIKVEQFLQYHILDKRTVIPDGKDIGSFPSLYKNAAGDPVSFTIQYTGSVFEVKDQLNRVARLVTTQTPQLSNRTVIHLIDNYLRSN
jgi:uncharacterized surface protein with fasciclin (FAS1) repeats